jgi:N-acetyl-S-(2-succino)cysteine monooxygenase
MAKRNGPAVWASFVWPGGQHHGAWRQPGSLGGDTHSFEAYKRGALAAERGVFDAFFLGDRLDNWPLPDHLLARTARGPRLETITVTSMLAGVTSKIGLVATASTSFTEPFNIARQMGSLDWITGGRAGWNIVTSYSNEQAQNFGLDRLPRREDRYARAEEFLQVVKGLWDSFDDGAMLVDRENGIFFDPQSTVHRINHEGDNFKVAGPLNMGRPPQGYPVIAQAGASASGSSFAARNGEILFSISSNIDRAKEYYKLIKEGAVKAGRDPQDIRILASINPVVGRTQKEADAKYDRMQSYLDPDVTLMMAEDYLGMDLSRFELDEPLPELEQTTSSNMPQAHADFMITKARDEGLTLRELIAGFNGVNINPRSAEAAADEFQHWYEEEACDGFIIQFAQVPEGIEEFVDLVVPILRDRGLIREEYVGTTLREHIGLKRPPSQYAAETAVATTAV